jgi:molybdopterin converting factor small subunit
VTEQGQIRPHINVFVVTEDVRYTGGLATRITAGGAISILPAVSAG